MDSLARAPHPALRPFVISVWASDSSAAAPVVERMLPSVSPHLVIRLGAAPVEVMSDVGTLGTQIFGPAVVGGPRTRFYSRSGPAPGRTVGAVLCAGATEPLLGVRGSELAQRHTDLGDLWGTAGAESAAARLTGIDDLETLLVAFEAILRARLRQPRAIHPAVASLLASLPGSRVRDLVSGTGYSHRHVTELFCSATGLTPKAYARVARLERALTMWGSAPNVSLARLAAAAGYSDQPHLSREFKDFSGMTLGDYRRAARPGSRHVSLPHPPPLEVNFLQDAGPW